MALGPAMESSAVAMANAISRNFIASPFPPVPLGPRRTPVSPAIGPHSRAPESTRLTRNTGLPGKWFNPGPGNQRLLLWRLPPELNSGESPLRTDPARPSATRIEHLVLVPDHR